MDAFGGAEPQLKRFRPFAPTNNGSSGGARELMECKHYNTPQGCAFGNSCRFQHAPVATGETEALPPNASTKTKPCSKFFSTSGCSYGENCHFQHYVPGGVAALGKIAFGTSGVTSGPTNLGLSTMKKEGGPNNLMKTRICNLYGTAEGCGFGDKCHFAHGEQELRKSNGLPISKEQAALSFDGSLSVDSLRGASALEKRGGGVAQGRYEPSPPGMVPAAASFGASSTAKISIEASVAGIVIGKAGVNAKQISRLTGARLVVRDHETDPAFKNIELEGTFDQIKLASQMVQEVLIHKDSISTKPTGFVAANNFKTKMCENYAKGVCTFRERCHFAHSASELRDHSFRP